MYIVVAKCKITFAYLFILTKSITLRMGYFNICTLLVCQILQKLYIRQADYGKNIENTGIDKKI